MASAVLPAMRKMRCGDAKRDRPAAGALGLAMAVCAGVGVGLILAGPLWADWAQGLWYPLSPGLK